MKDEHEVSWLVRPLTGARKTCEFEAEFVGYIAYWDRYIFEVVN